MTKLGVNVDHIATLRQARQAPEPDPVASWLNWRGRTESPFICGGIVATSATAT